MSIRKKTNATERKGVNFIRRLFEDANCVFKEVAREHDYGHDAFVLLVDGEAVLPKEIALQIKSGVSYCKADSCQFAATAKQLEFWRLHPLRTLGVVYDPIENCAYWIDLKATGHEFRLSNENSHIVGFQKEEWNRIDSTRFNDLFLPSLLGKPAQFDLKLAIDWANSAKFEQHEIGLRTLFSRFLDNEESWDAIFRIFAERDPISTSSAVVWILAHIPWHYDMFGDSRMSQALEATRPAGEKRISRFGRPEVTKLLSFIDENGLQRGSTGQDVAAVLSIISNIQVILREIATDREIDEELTEWARFLSHEGRMYLARPR